MLRIYYLSLLLHLGFFYCKGYKPEIYIFSKHTRLRKKVCDEQESLDNLPIPEPESTTQKALRVTHHQRDDKPKGIEEQILELHAGILAQMDELHTLRSELKEGYVPASVCQHLDQCVRDTEADVLKVLSTNEYLEKTIQVSVAVF